MKTAIGGQKELNCRVKETGLCTSCGACVNLCPYQACSHDDVVALHPCDIKQGACYAFCPRTPTDLENLRESLFSPQDLTPELGAVKGFYIARSTDADIRADGAQHGGAVTALMTLALEAGFADTAVLTGDGGNLLAQGIEVRHPEQVKTHGMSRFVVSPLLGEFNRLAKEGGKRLGVVATPCQSLALAKMRMKPLPDYADRIDQLKLVIGLFCGWALSWRKLTALLRRKFKLSEIGGMDIPPSKYHSLQVNTPNGPVDISLDEVTPCVRDACWHCADLTAEFSDISVGSARLPQGWEEARQWNQLLVRTARGQELLNLASERGVLEFREVPEGNLEKLKAASMGKKRTALKNLRSLSGNPDDLFYLDPQDPVLSSL